MALGYFTSLESQGRPPGQATASMGRASSSVTLLLKETAVLSWGPQCTRCLWLFWMCCQLRADSAVCCMSKAPGTAEALRCSPGRLAARKG